MIFYLHPKLKPYFLPPFLSPLFDQLMGLRGQLFREQKGRLTQRVMIGDRAYFIKQHRGVGLKEIIKNICFLRRPVISAKEEWQALFTCKQLGLAVPKVYAYGERGQYITRLQSFILMEELAPTMSVETLTNSWPINKLNINFKRYLIKKIAETARTLHTNGINHRDFYLCHFLLSLPTTDTASLYLIDLHRAQIRTHTPMRWLIKDLAGLYFSSKHLTLTKRDFYFFIKIYTQQQHLNLPNNFWEKVFKRGEQLYRDHL